MKLHTNEDMIHILESIQRILSLVGSSPSVVDYQPFSKASS